MVSAPVIVPSSLTINSELSCQVEVVPGAAGDFSRVTIEWQKNGQFFASTVIPDPDLIAYYPFDDSQNIGADYAQANDLSSTGVSFIASGKVGGAAEFDSYSDFLEVLDNPSLNVTGPFSIEAWVKPYENLADIPESRIPFLIKKGSIRLLFRGGTTWSSTVPHFGWNGFALDFDSASGFHWDSGWTRWAPKDEWVHVVGVFDNNMIWVYQDGVAVQNRNLGFGSTAVSGNGAFSINKGSQFKGLVDEVALYKRALSPLEIRGHFAGGYWGGARLPSRFLQKGDSWSCKVTPQIRSGNGSAQTSISVLVAGNPVEQEPVKVPFIPPIRFQNQPFFPIAIWAPNTSLLGGYSAVGINSVLGSPENSQPSVWNPLALDLNIRVFAHFSSALVNLDSVVGWLLKDEPECAQNNLTLPEALKSTSDSVKSQDPQSRPTLVNHCSPYNPKDDDFWASKLEGDKYRKYFGATDLISWTAIYPANDGHPENSYKVGLGSEKLGLLSDFQKPYFAAIEATDIQLGDANPEPSPQAVRNQAWSAVVHGARGIGYFTHSFRNGSWTGYFTTSTVLKQELTRTNRQITNLADAILSQPSNRSVLAVESQNRRMDFSVRDFNGKTFIFAVNADNQMRSESVLFSVAGLSAGTAVQRVDETALTAISNGFSDSFEPQGIHIYLIDNACSGLSSEAVCTGQTSCRWCSNACFPGDCCASAECNSGFQCVNHQCISQTPVCPNGSVSSACLCGTQTISSGWCCNTVPNAVSCASCLVNSDCNVSSLCCSSVCLVPLCDSNSDCSSTQFCRDVNSCSSVCVSFPVCGSGAVSSKCLCGTSAVTSGFCCEGVPSASVCSQTSCSANADCNSGKLCCSSQCITSICDSNADCSAGYECKNPDACNSFCSLIPLKHFKISSPAYLVNGQAFMVGVKDDAGNIVSQARVAYADENKETDFAGKVSFSGKTGKTIIEIAKAGFQTVKIAKFVRISGNPGTVPTVGGDIALSLLDENVLIGEPFSVMVSDTNGEPISDATVRYGAQTQKSDASGIVELQGQRNVVSINASVGPKHASLSVFPKSPVADLNVTGGPGHFPEAGIDWFFWVGGLAVTVFFSVVLLRLYYSLKQKTVRGPDNQP
ncbi:MAG: LamG domain-containing protein [Candidatus Diapherotrites archaeon]|uniref:LamG domain-containing protein n=1 Tax=Candidatus Iainarchaeum sp. TaxID=3101447 RepID=A0A8T4L3C6_9ARCH|nr:LamG domain-containing protein [Candidatus Diapherotrites archaeon]